MENKDDLKKFFDPKEYVTKIVGSEEEQEVPASKADKISSLISLLTDPENKDVKEEALLTLKKEKGGSLLLEAISKTKKNDKKAVLIAACWESEINFSADLPFFVDLSMDKDYFVSLEAITVIENMEGPFDPKAVADAMKQIKTEQKKMENERVVLLNDLLMTLEGFSK
jgi:hypothetical protein